MKKLTVLCFIVGALGVSAQQEKPIVILEENVKQSGGQWQAGTSNTSGRHDPADFFKGYDLEGAEVTWVEDSSFRPKTVEVETPDGKRFQFSEDRREGTVSLARWNGGWRQVAETPPGRRFRIAESISVGGKVVIMETTADAQASNRADNKDRIVGSKAYEGDPVLNNAFRTVHRRLETLLINSGRVNVKSKMSIDKTVTDANVYLCSYELVQGRQVAQPGRKKLFILELNMRAWNYKDDTPLPELTRTLRTQNFYDTPEDAIAFITRYLAFTTLEAVSPVTVTEIEIKKEKTDVAINVGGEILKKGDKLKMKSGLTGTIGLTVVETEATQTICTIDNAEDVKSVKKGARITFPEPKPTVIQNQCGTCGKSGIIVCPECRGNGSIETQPTEERCTGCSGTGTRGKGFDGKILPCLTCKSLGTVNKTQKVACSACKGARRIKCPDCNDVVR